MNMNPSLLLAGIGVAVTGLIGYNAVHKPQQRQLGLVRTQVMEEQTRQQAAMGVAELLHQIEQYRKRLPEEPDPSWLVRQVVALAEQSGVQLTTISQEPPQRFEQFTRLAVRVQITATYHQLGTFLDHIERAPQYLRVEQLEVSRSRSGQAGGQPETVHLMLSTLYVSSGLSAVGGGVVP